MSTLAAPPPTPPLTLDEIERRAANLLREHGLEDVPVSPLAVADRLGVAVRLAEFTEPDTAAITAKYGDDVTVYVRAADPPSRKRLAVAHALGHRVLHLGGGDAEVRDAEVDLYVRADDPDRRREAEANAFAAALLMPEPAVRAAWPWLETVAAMARRFRVPRAAMGGRLAALGLA